MSRRTTNQAEAPGQDSFLDVVANLVGVMIILVMVVGTQARHAIEAAVPVSENATDSTAALNVQQAKDLLYDQEKALRDMREKLAAQEREVQYRRGERDQVLTLCSAVEQSLTAAKSKLSDNDRTEVDLKVAVNQTQRELENLSQMVVVATAETSPTEVLKHYPTPIAKTVFGQEVHFSLQKGRLTFVPFEEFVQMLKEDAPRRVAKLRDADRVTESLGPIAGYYMKYALKRETVLMPSGSGNARQERAALEQFVLVPTREDLGEPVAAALAANSEFRTVLREYDPKRCTVTLWVYPDSFQHFRPVREELMKLGFTSAGRPMPDGHPIGGSPEGSRSASQ
jgi:hypothetical protein